MSDVGDTPILAPLQDFSHVKVGDVVERLLAGIIPMNLEVTKVDDTLIYCATPAGNDAWTFDRKTGIEVDEELGFGPDKGISGSYLTRVVEYIPRECSRCGVMWRRIDGGPMGELCGQCNPDLNPQQSRK